MKSGLEKAKKNPYEIYDVYKTNAFFVTADFSKAESKNGVEPLKLHADFSRLVFHIISDKGIHYFANVRKSLIAGMMRKLDAALQLEASHSISNKADKQASLPSAYTKKFRMGNLKGKTPAMVLLENPANGLQILQTQYQFLQQNAHKYKSNAELMEAISNAVHLFQTGQLNSQSAASVSSSVVLYEISMRPLKSYEDKTRPGWFLIYSFRILYDQGADRPFTFEITNYYAPVITKEDGTLNVQKGDSPTSVSTNLSFMEVSDLYDCIQCNKENFERYVYAEKRKEADRFSYDNYTARVQNVNYAPVSQPLVR